MSKAMAKIEKKHGYLADALDILNGTQRGIKNVEKASPKQDTDMLEDLGLTTPAVFFTWNDTTWVVGYDEEQEGIRLVCVDPFALVDALGEKMAAKLGAEYISEAEEEEGDEDEEEEDD